MHKMTFTNFTAYGKETETYRVPTDLETIGKMWDSYLIKVCGDLITKSLAGSFSDVRVEDLDTMNSVSLRITVVDLAGGREGIEYTREDVMHEEIQFCPYRGS